MSMSVGQTPSFGCSKCEQVRNILGKQGVSPKAIDRYLNTSIACATLFSEGYQKNLRHVQKADSLLRCVQNPENKVAENLKKQWLA